MKIYITGDIGSKPRVYDSQTDIEVLGLATVDASFGPVVGGAEATLTYMSGRKEVVDIVRAPPPKARPFSLGVVETPHCGVVAATTIITATLDRAGLPAHRVSVSVSDVDRINAPYDLMEERRTYAIQEVLRPLIRSLAATSRGAYTTVPVPVDPASVTKAKPLDLVDQPDLPVSVCKDCGGTGKIQLFNSEVPCSACKPSSGKSMCLAQWEDAKPVTKDVFMSAVHTMETFNCRSIVEPVMSLAEERAAVSDRLTIPVVDITFRKLPLVDPLIERLFYARLREPAVAARPSCDECGGTGEIEMFTSVEPCSKCVTA